MQRRFLWGGDEGNRKMAWVKWDQICLRKSKGGLGIRNLEAFNIALLAKWRWRFLVEESNATWKQVLIERYGSQGPWFKDEDIKKGLKGSSIWWRDLLVLGAGSNVQSEWFNETVKKKIGNGSSMLFWLEAWLGRESFANMFPSLFNVCGLKEVKVSEMGKWQDNEWQWVWDWTINLPEEVDQDVQDLKVLLLGINLAKDVEDKWCWMPDTTNGFTVKNCYNWLCTFFAGNDESVNEETASACRKLWKNDVPSKVLIFSWRLLLDRLATREALHKRGVLSSIRDLSCVLCFKETETNKHIFCDCEFTRKVWNDVFAWMGWSYDRDSNLAADFLAFGERIEGKKRKGVRHLIWIAVAWSLWVTRNNVLFKGTVANINSTVMSIKYTTWSWFVARKGRNCDVTLSLWLSNPVDCFMLL